MNRQDSDKRHKLMAHMDGKREASTMTPEKAQALLDEFDAIVVPLGPKTKVVIRAFEDLARAYIAQAAEITRLQARLAAAEKLAEALRSKTVMDPNNSNSTWLDAQARAALSTFQEGGK